ncbi:MFS transporter [Rhodococcus sp. NPDC057014]|uniref:MFS transporter n=1 Tax=Rhodococcus sp. NPDC057014 TaxID=3346000 RepID=UPI0036346FC7
MLIEVAGMFEQAMVLGSLPFFANLFGINLAAAAWVITIFVLTGAASAILAGKLGDMYGRRRVVLVLLAVSLAGSLITITFGTFPALLIGRALQGTSIGIVPLLIGIARETLPKSMVPTTVAYLTATGTITAGVGMFVAGLFIDSGDWHYMFVVTAALCAVTLILTRVFVPESTITQSGTIDWVGAALMAPGLISLLYGISVAQGVGLTDAGVLASIGIGSAVLAVWVWWELRVPSPLVDLRLLVNPKLAKTMIVILLTGLATISVNFVSNPLLALSPAEYPIGIGLTATTFGSFALVASIITFIVTPLSGRIAARHGAPLAMVIGVALLVAVYIALMIPAINSSVAGFFLANMTVMIGNSFVISSMFNLVVEAVPTESTSQYIGVAQVASNVSRAVGTVIASVLLSSSVMPGSTAPTVAAWNLTMIYSIVVSVVVLVIASYMFARRRATRSAEAPHTIADTEVATV